MNPTELLYLIIAISAVAFAAEQLLDLLNLRAQRDDVPETVAGFYDRGKYLKSLSYHADVTRFGFITSAFGFALSISMLATGAFGWLDTLIRTWASHEIAVTLVFFAIIIVASDALTLPFQYYRTFVIEARYGFNKTTPRTFVADKLKGYLIGAVVGGALISLLVVLVQTLGRDFWMWFALAAAGFMLVANIFYTTWILPLFNKLTPLPEGELKNAIHSYAGRVGFPLDNIYVIDGSKRSTKANAFFSGIGRKKKIVLYDTLISNHTTDELVAVLAHEVGHFKKKHIVQRFALSVLQIAFTLFVFSRVVLSPEISLALGGQQTSIALNLLAFGILFSPVSAITGLLLNLLSRRNEYQADAYASETFGAVPLAEALKRLSVDNLSNLYPHPLYVFVHYSHPPLLKRLAALRCSP